MSIHTVGVVVFRENRVLLVRHGEKAKQRTGVCGLPSGHPEGEETETQAAARELREETGLVVGKGNLFTLVLPFQATVETKTGPVDYTWKVFLATDVTG